MLNPLTQFVCDSCGEIIDTVEVGWLEWLVDPVDQISMYSFRIVHHASQSPRKSYGRNCYHPREAIKGDMHLDHFTGSSGLAVLLWMLSRPQKKQAELIEIIRRLHIPYYEEARRYFGQAEQDEMTSGMDIPALHSQHVLQEIVKKYASH